MKKEFLDYWQSPANMPFPDSHKDLELWCNNAFLAGAAAMREKCAEVAMETDIEPSHCNEYGELTRRYDCWLNGVSDTCEQISAAIRKLEVI